MEVDLSIKTPNVPNVNTVKVTGFVCASGGYISVLRKEENEHQ
jgi:hypothetical protein